MNDDEVDDNELNDSTSHDQDATENANEDNLGPEHFKMPDGKGGYRRGYKWEYEQHLIKARQLQGKCDVLLFCGHWCCRQAGHSGGHFCNQCAAPMP